MSEKLDVKEIIKVGAILFVITALAAALLGFVNAKTAPLIAENNIKKEQTALKAVMPDAADFKEIELTPELKNVEDGRGEITKAYAALDQSGRVTGACVITETSGYDIGIQTVTGVNEDKTVAGVEIISLNETPGLGAKATDASFREQYTGKSAGIGVSKSGATDADIQAISGATLTSRGVTNGVNIALDAAEIILEGGNG